VQVLQNVPDCFTVVKNVKQNGLETGDGSATAGGEEADRRTRGRGEEASRSVVYSTSGATTRRRWGSCPSL
jgi:hypothetical protein